MNPSARNNKAKPAGAQVRAYLASLPPDARRHLLLVAAIGAAIVRAPTYRPDLGDVSLRFDPFGAKTRQTSPSKRSWWTGDLLT